VNEFLRANQEIVAPIIEWVGLLVLLAIILSPFLIIRYPKFRPTRWWHVVAAYVSSIILLIIIVSFLFSLIGNHLLSLLGTFEFKEALSTAIVNSWFWLVVIYPLLLFYSTRILYGRFTRKTFLMTLISAIALFMIFASAISVLSVAFLGYALFNNLN